MVRLTPERCEQLLEAIAEVRVVVVGDLILDRYMAGPVDRVSPEAPVPVVRVQSRWSAIGGAGNVAANAAALGAEVHVVGCVGRDEPGSEVLAALEAAGVRTGGVVETPGRRTTVKTRVLALHQQIVRFDEEVEEDIDDPLSDSVAELAESLLEQADVVVLEDYDKGVLATSTIRRILAAADRLGLPSVADPKRKHFFDYHGVRLFKPNRKELAEALGEPVRPDDPAWMEATRDRLGCAHLLLTLGADGMALQSAGVSTVRVPAVQRSVYDVSGAGDTVSAVCALALAAGGSAIECAVLANHAAAIEVGKSGVSTVTADELRDGILGPAH